MAYQALLFDLDGTLVETVQYWIDASVAALAEGGIAVSAAQFEEWYRQDRILKHVLVEQGYDRADVDRIRARRDVLYTAALRSRASWLPYAEEMLTHVAGCLPLALVTNSHRIYVDAIAERLALRSFFRVIVTVDDMGGLRKPHPHSFLLACDALGVDPARCLSVGDRIVDIEASRAAGMPSCLVPNAFTTEQAKEEAGIVIDSLLPLLRIVEG